MSFREDHLKYKELRNEWNTVVKRAYCQGKGIVISEVDDLMLASYKLWRCIRQYLSNVDGISKSNIYTKVPALPQALKEAKEVVNTNKGVVALFYEAEKLESLSRSAYLWLKENNRLKKGK